MENETISEVPVIGKELADFWEELLIEIYFDHE